uniref:Uncharacterized protein n=1 Tax=Heterorhabditis bacteriophora TaxID=37862 RepID=A0A1I7XVN4_HETBA
MKFVAVDSALIAAESKPLKGDSYAIIIELRRCFKHLTSAVSFTFSTAILTRFNDVRNEHDVTLFTKAGNRTGNTTATGCYFM